MEINAPTGRIANVRKIASLMVETLAWNWPASAFRQKTRMKKSKASSDQPRKQATKVFRCVVFSRRKCAMNSMNWNIRVTARCLAIAFSLRPSGC